jgi:tetratricopeptide (TPR) repeat protein
VRRLWTFISDKTNQQIISWLGGGIVVVVAAAWTVFIYVREHADRPAPAASPVASSVTQSGTGIASGGNTTINGPVNIGLDEKKLEQRFDASDRQTASRLDALAAEMARQKGVEAAPLRAILSKLGEAGVGDADIAQRLAEKADELVRLRNEVARLRQGPAELASFAAQAQVLLGKGDLDGARAALAAGRAAAKNLREQSSRYEADFLAREAAVDHLQLAYRSAAAKYAEAAGLMAAVDQRMQWAFVLTQAEELYHQGDEFGDRNALAEAVRVYRTALSLAPRAERPLDWAATQNDLGVTLLALGAGETGTARLDEAAAALREALQERTRAKMPIDWAKT